MSLIDWAIMAFGVIAIRVVSLSTRSYMKGVADFLSANRSAGRYLLTIASSMGTLGVISFVAQFEMYYQAGFTPCWWNLMMMPTLLVIMLSGWIFYRFRETRALTMAQFFEMRYSRRFRVFAGFLCWACGVLNFGIFPAVTARFFIYFCGLPDHFHVLNLPWHISTFATVMAVDLILALTFVTMGGQVSVMVTECVQGIAASFIFLIVTAAVLMKIKWPLIVEALSKTPANSSMLHPFHAGKISDFNLWYFLIAVFGAYYSYMSWQGTQGFYSAARTPHEQKMGGILSTWRTIPQTIMALVLPIGAYAFLNLPQFAGQAESVSTILNGISNPAVAEQMRVPVALAYMLPIGVKGLLATVMLFVSFTCHDSYMHSWGSIFIQDVYMPLRKRPLSPQQHIRLLRWSIIGVAAFAFMFSLIYPQTQKLFMFFAITGTIWLGGSGITIIGGLYWKRGTTAAAYSALLVGATLGVAGLVIPQIYEAHYHHKFPINGQFLYLIGMVSASLVYVIVSLLTCKKDRMFDITKMLNRGVSDGKLKTKSSESIWMRVVGINKDFSLGDRILAISLVAWSLGWFLLFIVVTALNTVFHFGNGWWSAYWHYLVIFLFVVSVPFTIWFAVGGVMDIRSLLKTLSVSTRDHTDDGRVLKECETESLEKDRSIH